MCPHCGSEKTAVIETRVHEGEKYRRRKCGNLDCGKRFMSIETVLKDDVFPSAVWSTPERKLRHSAPKPKPAFKIVNNDAFRAWG